MQGNYRILSVVNIGRDGTNGKNLRLDISFSIILYQIKTVIYVRHYLNSLTLAQILRIKYYAQKEKIDEHTTQWLNRR